MAGRVAIQGYKGCFHEQAARLFYDSAIEVEECDTFDGLYTAMDSGRFRAVCCTILNCFGKKAAR